MKSTSYRPFKRSWCPACGMLTVMDAHILDLADTLSRLGWTKCYMRIVNEGMIGDCLGCTVVSQLASKVILRNVIRFLGIKSCRTDINVLVPDINRWNDWSTLYRNGYRKK